MGPSLLGVKGGGGPEKFFRWGSDALSAALQCCLSNKMSSWPLQNMCNNKWHIYRKGKEEKDHILRFYPSAPTSEYGKVSPVNTAKCHTSQQGQADGDLGKNNDGKDGNWEKA